MNDSSLLYLSILDPDCSKLSYLSVLMVICSSWRGRTLEADDEIWLNEFGGMVWVLVTKEPLAVGSSCRVLRLVVSY